MNQIWIRIGSVLAALWLTLAPAASAAEINLKPGEAAPAASGLDQDGKPWALADYAGKQSVLLYFYPKDGTPGCTKEACGLRDSLAMFNNAKVAVVGVSMDGAGSHQKFIADQKLNFTLLADTEGKLTDLFGARMPGKQMARRVSFLIDPQGKLVHITDHPAAEKHLEEMKAAIAQLKAPR